MRSAATEITACIVARDEEATLPECLASARGAATELLVVDHGSRDETAAVARAAGARVIASDAAFGELARNTYLDEAKTGWVLVLDADERLSAEGAAALARIVAGADAGVSGFALERWDWIGFGRWASTRLVRLFRRDPRIRYFRSRAHAAVVPSIGDAGGLVAFADAPLHHIDALLPRDHAKKRAGMRARLEHELAQSEPMTILRCFQALELFAIGDQEGATEHLERALQDDERCEPIARLFLAQQHVVRGRFREAAREAERVLDLRENRRFRGRASAFVALANAQDALGDREAATATLRAALGEEPSSASHHLGLAALLEEHRPAEARAHLSRARALNPWLGAARTLGAGAAPCIFRQQDAVHACVGRVDALVERLSC